MKRRNSTTVLAICLLALVTIAAHGWEKPRTFKAKSILTPEQLAGEYHEVGNKVTVDHFYYVFLLQSEFGDLEAVGRDDLDKRIYEMTALKALNEVSKTDVFMDAAGASLKATGEGLVQLAKHPKKTVNGLGSGIKRFGINIGRATKRTYEDWTTDEGDEEGDDQSTAEETKDFANAAFGVNKSVRAWAEKLQVDPYSRNPILQEALLDIAQIDRAGSLITKIAVPIPEMVKATSKVSRMVWKQDPETLRKTNEASLGSIGVAPEAAARYFRNESYTLTHQTRFANAVAEVPVEGIVDFVDTATTSENPRVAVFFVESAEMLVGLHSERPVDRVLTASRSIVAGLGTTAIVLLPLDYVAWTEEAAENFREIGERSRTELGATEIELRIHGVLSKRARKELDHYGWSAVENADRGAAAQYRFGSVSTSGS